MQPAGFPSRSVGGFRGQLIRCLHCREPPGLMIFLRDGDNRLTEMLAPRLRIEKQCDPQALISPV